MFANLRREFPAPSMTVFFLLQLLDVVTTLLGLRLGAGEASFFVGRLMKFGALEGLIIAKLFAIVLVAAALAFHRPRVVVFLNYWFAALITWNLITIFASFARG
jgi:hypothetical protein